MTYSHLKKVPLEDINEKMSDFSDHSYTLHTVRPIAHAAANLNSGYSRYAKVARVHYFVQLHSEHQKTHMSIALTRAGLIHLI